MDDMERMFKRNLQINASGNYDKTSNVGLLSTSPISAVHDSWSIVQIIVGVIIENVTQLCRLGRGLENKLRLRCSQLVIQSVCIHRRRLSEYSCCRCCCCCCCCCCWWCWQWWWWVLQTGTEPHWPVGPQNHVRQVQETGEERDGHRLTILASDRIFFPTGLPFYMPWIVWMIWMTEICREWTVEIKLYKVVVFLRYTHSYHGNSLVVHITDFIVEIISLNGHTYLHGLLCIIKNIMTKLISLCS